MKHENGDGIMHGLFVDDMVHASTSENFNAEKLKLDSIAEYTRGTSKSHERNL